MKTTYITTNQAPPVQTTYVTTTGPVQPPQTTYIEVIQTPRRQRNRYVNNSTHTATAGLLLFAYGGMDMAQGLGWNLFSVVPMTHQLQYSWFIGVIIGAVVAALTVTHLPKWVFYALGGLMQLADGIIFVSAYDNYSAIMAARYLGGVAIGLITVPYIIHNSEVSPSNSRGQWVGFEQYGLSLGLALQVIICSEWGDDYYYFSLNVAHGIFGIVFAFIATCAVVMSVESPVFHLRRNNEEKARLCQSQLYSTLTPAATYNAAFEEAKQYVAEGNSQSTGAQLSASLMPFIKMLIVRCLVAFSFSLPLSVTMSQSSNYTIQYSYWTNTVWAVLRFVGALFGIVLVDTAGRKSTSLVGLLCMAGLMLGMAGIYSYIGITVNEYYMRQLLGISMAFQFFGGLYVVSTSTYLGEAFPMQLKPYFMGLIVCIEQVIHIIVIVTFGKYADCFFQYYLVVGIILALGVITFALLMPETKRLTLRKAGERFRRVHDVMPY